MHLSGAFETTLDEVGALKTYMDSRVDDDSLKKTAYNPDVQMALGLVRGDNESRENYEARVNQVIALFSRAKFDAAYLLAQLHFDRGDYGTCANWLRERLLFDQRATRWHAAGWYLLARSLIEMEQYGEADNALLQPSIPEGSQAPAFVINPQDAGNRIRLRYLRRLTENSEKE
jgi:hypothetical protein